MTAWFPILLLIISVIFLILSIFLYFYYGNNLTIDIIFALGIVFGILACLIFIYLRSPSTYAKNIDNTISYDDVIYDDVIYDDVIYDDVNYDDVIYDDVNYK